MAQKLTTTTADVVIAFQQNPGIDNDSIINAGVAKIAEDDEVQPVRGGYYGLSIDQAQSQQLKIFGMTYNVHRKAKNGDEASARVKIISWDNIWDSSKNKRVQHCLQLLGYYRGSIDGILARQTEEALLAFQADNKLPTRGLEWLRDDNQGDAANPNERNVGQIVSVVNSKNKISKQDGGAVYLIRKSLIRFTRAPTANPDDHYGPAVLGAPDVDDRGFVRAEANGHKCRGPVTSYSYDPAHGADNSFRVKVIRDGIADDANLVAESENPNYVSIPNLSLLKRRYMNLEMTAGNPGRKSRKVKVYIKWRKSADSLITIATLRVIIMPIKTLAIQPWLVGIRDNVLSENNRLPQLDDVTLAAIINRTNAIWRPYGIKFRMRGSKEFHVTLYANDIVSIINNGHMRESKTIFRNWAPRRGDHAGRTAPRDAINVYIVKEIEGAFGSTISPFRRGRDNKTGIILENRQEGPQRTGDTLAHELGHFLGLANNYGNTKYTHVEDIPDASADDDGNKPKRQDVWRIRRLMLGTRPDRLTDHDWAHRVGYSGPADPPHINGKMLSLRNLNLRGDKTDNECENARKRSRNRNVYYG